MWSKRQLKFGVCIFGRGWYLARNLISHIQNTKSQTQQARVKQDWDVDQKTRHPRLSLYTRKLKTNKKQETKLLHTKREGEWLSRLLTVRAIKVLYKWKLHKWRLTADLWCASRDVALRWSQTALPLWNKEKKQTVCPWQIVAKYDTCVLQVVSGRPPRSRLFVGN